MTLFLDMICGLVTTMTVSAFAQFGVTLDTGEKDARPAVHRTVPAAAPAAARASRPTTEKASWIVVRRVGVRQAEQKAA